MNRWNRYSVQRGMIICSIIFLLISCILGWYTYSVISSGEQLALQRGKTEAETTVIQIEAQLQVLVDTTETLTRDLNSGRLADDKAIVARLQQEHDRHPELHGVGIVFTPYAFSSDRRLYGPYFTRRDNTLQLVQVEDHYDYTLASNRWYHLPIDQQKAVWIEPFYGLAGQVMSTEYNAPFTLPDRVPEAGPSGVVTTVFSLNHLNKLLNSFSLGATGYGFLLSQKGNFIAHPSEEILATGMNIKDEALRVHSRLLTQAAEQALVGQSSHIEYVDPDTGEDVWIFFEPVKLSGWVLGVKTTRRELMPSPKTLRQLSITLAGCLLLASLFAIWGVGFGRFGLDNSASLIGLSVLSALIYIAAISFIWWTELNSPINYQQDMIKVVDTRSLNAFLDNHTERSQTHHLEPPLHIPTGVFLQSIEFNNSNDVEMTGYLWQKYDHTLHRNLSRGFVFPEASEVSREKVYTRHQGETELVGWYFKAILREPFDYQNYPLDRENVWLRIWHQDFDRNVVLTPDFSSYRSMHPASLPGIEQDFVIPGWTLKSSFFAYQLKNYNTDFGIIDYCGKENFPELYYNVLISRNIINPLLSKIISLVVVLIMLYAILSLSNKSEPLEVILGSAALFFIAVLDHIALRENLAVNGIVYLETFYFIAYGAILIVALNSAIRYSKIDLFLLEYNDNILAKIAFWPILMGALLIVTVFTFY